MSTNSTIMIHHKSVLRIQSIFFVSVSGSADPVFKIRIRIRGTPKKPGSDRIRILLGYIFDVKQNKYFLRHFPLKSNHLTTLKIKDKILFEQTCILDTYI